MSAEQSSVNTRSTTSSFSSASFRLANSYGSNTEINDANPFVYELDQNRARKISKSELEERRRQSGPEDVQAISLPVGSRTVDIRLQLSECPDGASIHKATVVIPFGVMFQRLLGKHYRHIWVTAGLGE